MTAESAPVTEEVLDFIEAVCAQELPCDNDAAMGHIAAMIMVCRVHTPRLVAEVRRLREVVLATEGHDPMCPRDGYAVYPEGVEPCNCGYDAAIAYRETLKQ